ncbi:hypothetical protein Mapa_002272 [Marchantia paleacea]|nr:hypothetical protein Mapa_002272 [Marchantia paleacea]
MKNKIQTGQQWNIMDYQSIMDPVNNTHGHSEGASFDTNFRAKEKRTKSDDNAPRKSAPRRKVRQDL